MKQGIKSRTLPLPVYSGELADWRSFWRRFLDYLDHMPRLTTDEKLTFLLECIHDQSACNIIKYALQNGDSFEFVEKRLAVKFDQPRKVFTDVVQKLKRLPATANSAKGVSACSELTTKYYNILSKFGDGTMAQLLTSFLETTLDDELLREWRKYAHNPVSTHSGTHQIIG